MPSNIRLTSRLRFKIRAALMLKRFDARRKALATEKSALAFAAYEAAFDAATRRKMNRLPAGWLPEISTIAAKFGYTEFYQALPDKKTVRVPSDKTGRYGSAPVLIAVGQEHPLYQRHAKMQAEDRAIEQEANDLTREIDAVLLSVSTASKLMTVWPEITATVEEICKHYVPSANLPAPRVDMLNKVLGLTKAA